MDSFVPWEKYPALELDRLVIVASAIRKGRASAVADHKPSEGDDAWTQGCLAYRRCCFSLAEASAEHRWLTILPEEPNRFTFAISGIPLKFYKGFADDPPSRSLARSFAELGSIQQSLDFGNVPDLKHLLRVAVETDGTGAAKAIMLVELDESGNVTGTFTIPDAGTGVLSMRPKPIDPGPPSFTPIQNEEEKKKAPTGRKTGTEGNAG